ncbi:replicative DNA helicase [Spirosoma fluviale]|uniref:DNA 5'-3' helicase n=1 Tax=Spirosoma fluviale TaxID=1597977 RepID=A0A286FCX1_9BACT|nr:DnaB-like helicase C-terminal domain-containing protein [Spirosoma fluviale]SOD81091.1 replicative DNA helicase [Spirosoma fluviale]
MNYELTTNHLVNVDEHLEAAILGTILSEPRQAGTMLNIIRKRSIFYSTRHQLVYDAIAELYAQDKPIDLVIVNRWMRAHKADQDISTSYLLDLMGQSYLTTIEPHCLILFQLAVKRYLGQYGRDLSRYAIDPAIDAFALISRLSTDIDAIMTNVTAMQRKTANDYLRESFQDIEDKKAGRKTGITFGIKQLDERTGGFSEGNLVVLAAGTGQGKTGVATHVIRHRCIDLQSPTGVVTLEMTGKEYMDRFIAAETSYSNSEINKGIGVDEMVLFNRTRRLVDLPLYIHDKPDEFPQLVLIIREWVRQHKVKVVVIDYLQKIKDSRFIKALERVTRHSGDLKDLAAELGIVILLLAQFNRDWEKRKEWDKRPMMSDLKESSSIEQDANAILFLFRPDRFGLQYADLTCDKYTMELAGAKFRGAEPTDRDDPWLLDYDGACNRLAPFNTLKLKAGFPRLEQFPKDAAKSFSEPIKEGEEGF